VVRQLQQLQIPRFTYYKAKGPHWRSFEGSNRKRAMRIVDNVHLQQPLRRCEEDKPYARGIEALGAKAHGEDECVPNLSQAGQELGEAFLPAEEQGDTLPNQVASRSPTFR
jgi:hypothetical protein